MRDYLSHEVRNVVATGHSGVGKNRSYARKVCCIYKGEDCFWCYEEGSSLIDYGSEQIRRRGISREASLVPIEWKDCKINFNDTPGMRIFIRGAGSGIAVGASALIVVDAAMLYSPTIMAGIRAQKRSIPTIFGEYRWMRIMHF